MSISVNRLDENSPVVIKLTEKCEVEFLNAAIRHFLANGHYSDMITGSKHINMRNLDSLIAGFSNVNFCLKYYL